MQISRLFENDNRIERDKWLGLGDQYSCDFLKLKIWEASYTWI